MLFLYTAEHGRRIRLKSGRVVTISGTNPRTSKGAECFMMEELLSDLTESEHAPLLDKLFAFVIDSDSSAESLIRNYPHSISQTRIFFDTGPLKEHHGDCRANRKV